MTRPSFIPTDLWASFLPAGRAIIATQHDRTGQPEVRVAELEARLGLKSSNSPSSDGGEASPKIPSGKKRGGQPGHPKHERVILPPDQVLDLATTCGSQSEMQMAPG
jgi:transposase